MKSNDHLQKLRRDVEAIFMAGVKRVDPFEAVKRFLRRDGNFLLLGEDPESSVKLDLGDFARVFVVGGGKATAPMARAVEELIGDHITRGHVNVKYGFGEPLEKVEVTEADHPLPDRNGELGTRKVLDILHGAGEGDLVVSLISGGGSALLPLPVDGITLQEKQAVTQRLLDSGAGIDEINAIRKHISGSKGGQMARAAAPAVTVNLMLSDVVGDSMDVIASGPFVPDRSTFRDAWTALERHDLVDVVPETVRRHLQEGAEGNIADTPKPGDPVFQKVTNLVIGSNIHALKSAAREAERLGYSTLILSSVVEGETREVARVHAAVAREVLRSGNPLPPPACVISGGETTVTIRGKGKGGRNQEFCLASAIEIEGLPPRVVILSGGTDGNDGPTDAAGAVVDPFTLSRGRDSGMEAWDYLDDNNAYAFFSGTGELLMTGPTRTNVMDIRVILVGQAV